MTQNVKLQKRVYFHNKPKQCLFLDKNECSGPVGCADDRGECINTVGSYYCSCKSPYIGDGYTCYCTSNLIRVVFNHFNTQCSYLLLHCY